MPTTNKGGKDLTKQQSIQQHDDVEINSILTKRFNKGIIEEIDDETIRDLLTNPQSSQKTLENLAFYYYISNGNIFQQFDLTRVLPRLNYSIGVIELNKKIDKTKIKINKLLRKVNHKELTRDTISQTITAGTICGIWLGDGLDLYPMIFNDLEYFFPAKRVNGKWVIWCDLEYFDNINELERDNLLMSLSPYITKQDYDNFKEDNNGYRYVELPVERGFVIKTHTLYRNQNLGIPWVSTSLYDLSHKKTLKDLEKAVSNKIVNAIGVLTIGNQEKPNNTIKPEIKKKIYSRTKEALESNEEKGVSLISLPEFVDLEFGKFDSSPLDPKKFESINSDLTNATGVSKGLTNGEGSYSTAKINLDIIYDKIAEILENIESEIYNKAINLLLSTNEKDNYYIEYEKGIPLSTKEKLDTYMKLVSMGYSISPVINMLGGDAKEFVDQSIREINDWNIRANILPPMTSYTMSDNTEDSVYGRPTNEGSQNENTVKSNDNNSNGVPKPSDG